MSNNEMVSVPRELTDEMAEAIASRAAVCGGGAYDIWEAVIAAAPVAQSQGEPVAYAAFADNGNIRCWSSNCEAVGLKVLAEGGSEIVPLYRHPTEQRALVAEKLVKRLAEEFPDSDTMLTVECVADLITEYLLGPQ